VLGKDKDPKIEAAIRDVDITPGMMNALKKQSKMLRLKRGISSSFPFPSLQALTYPL
jgi:hypothetical protein